MMRLPQGRGLLQEILRLYATGELGHEGEDLLNTSLLIPLYKDGRGEAIYRPIAVPSVFRKVYAKATVASYRLEIQAAAGPSQHAAMCLRGTQQMAQKLRSHWQRADDDTVYIRTDIRNVHRQAALVGLARAHPLLASLHHAWLHRPTTAVLNTPHGTRKTFCTHAGIPQGDPLSSLSFALVLAEPLADLAALPGCHPLAYADDTVVACPVEVAHEYVAAWRDSLAACGLSLNLDKLRVWNARGLDVPISFQESFPQAQSLLDMPLQTPHAIIALSTPVSLGGLGFLNPQHEAALHFLQAVLPSVEELPLAEDDRNPVGQLIAKSLDYLDHQAGKPLRPLIEHIAPHRMARKLREAFYEARRLQLYDLCPWLTPPGLPETAPSRPDIPWQWQRGLASWFKPSPPPGRPLAICHSEALGTSCLPAWAKVSVHASDHGPSMSPTTRLL